MIRERLIMQSDGLGSSALTKPRPCPFCGYSKVGDCGMTVIVGSTFRWRQVECPCCTARGPEIRVQTMGPGTPGEWEEKGEADAIQAWNQSAEEVDVEPTETW